MSVDKLVDSTQLDSDLTSVANAIRGKTGGSVSLTFPAEFVSAINGIPTGITPTGTISITSNGNIDVTNYATASVNVSPVLTLGAIRPDAEVWKEYREDTLLVTDKGVTIPAYSTTAQALVSGSDVINEDSLSDDYEYFVTWRFLIYPLYNTNTIGSGRQDFFAGAGCFDLFKTIPIKDLQGNKSSNFQSSYAIAARTQLCYWASSTTITCSTQSYGVYRASPSLTWGWGTTAASKKITVNLNPINIRGNANYLKQTYWEAITDIRSQYILQVWRCPKNGLNLNGWMQTQLSENISTAVSSPTHTLT